MLEIKYVIINAIVYPVYDLGDDNFVQITQVFKQKDVKIFNTKVDALYTCVIQRLQNGAPLSNYKSSKFYNEYVQRLKIEHPEYII